jgi:hypothetical protein
MIVVAEQALGRTPDAHPRCEEDHRLPVRRPRLRPCCDPSVPPAWFPATGARFRLQPYRPAGSHSGNRPAAHANRAREFRRRIAGSLGACKLQDHTISRSWAFSALPSVIGGPGSDLI